MCRIFWNIEGNDVAERRVAFIGNYKNYRTKNKQHITLHYLLQVVREGRERYPNCYKKNL